jgi:uncharacterized protein
MRTSSALVCLTAALLIGAGPARALEVSTRSEARVGPPAFRSAKEALRFGVKEYNAGHKAGAAQALEYAAREGDALARWKLGRMFAEGDGVPADDLRAFEYFSRIADENAGDDGPDSPNAGVIASAYVALGAYFLDGIKGTYVQPDPVRARELFHIAAVSYGDPNGQFSLGRMYLDGAGMAQDAREAARWFNLAANRGHYPSQALLGHLLVNGHGVPRQRARGLMWLTLARDAADPDKDQWVLSLYSEAFQGSGPVERQSALAQLEQFLKSRR